MSALNTCTSRVNGHSANKVMAVSLCSWNPAAPRPSGPVVAWPGRHHHPVLGPSSRTFGGRWGTGPRQHPVWTGRRREQTQGREFPDFSRGAGDRTLVPGVIADVFSSLQALWREELNVS